MDPEIISEEPISMFEVKKRLESIKKSSGELNFRAQKTLDYLNQNTIIKEKKKVEEVYKKVEGLEIPRLKDSHIIKIVDTMPQSVEELKGILSAYTVSVTNENLKKIIGVLDDYV
ncbi:hypothetical protein GOV05_03935 [Candidatus Woesearchaeota archaeon]|nr:hypothetical protein [Candidatus Woesearchaeota archaeon]